MIQQSIYVCNFVHLFACSSKTTELVFILFFLMFENENPDFAIAENMCQNVVEERQIYDSIVKASNLINRYSRRTN